ncbi:hypothetical protein CR513_09271, partial [Mucuna pruriens]
MLDDNSTRDTRPKCKLSPSQLDGMPRNLLCDCATSFLESIFRQLVTITQPERDLARGHPHSGIRSCLWKVPGKDLELWRPNVRKARLSTYVTHSKSKAMESKIEVLEFQNQDLKGEVGQLKEQMAQMFQILSQTNATITAMTHRHAVHQEQERVKAEAQHQVSWTLPPFTNHQQMPQAEEKWQSLED